MVLYVLCTFLNLVTIFFFLFYDLTIDVSVLVDCQGSHGEQKFECMLL